MVSRSLHYSISYLQRAYNVNSSRVSRLVVSESIEREKLFYSMTVTVPLCHLMRYKKFTEEA
jgi:hypothetical protein